MMYRDFRLEYIVITKFSHLDLDSSALKTKNEEEGKEMEKKREEEKKKKK